MCPCIISNKYHLDVNTVVYLLTSSMQLPPGLSFHWPFVSSLQPGNSFIPYTLHTLSVISPGNCVLLPPMPNVKAQTLKAGSCTHLSILAASATSGPMRSCRPTHRELGFCHAIIPSHCGINDTKGIMHTWCR